MPTWLILNPKAGTAEEISRLEGVLERMEDLSVHRTAGPGDATRLARLAADSGAERILAAGGDGTLNEVLNGLAPDFRVGLGLLPLGTGNDFVRTLLGGGELERAEVAEQLVAQALRETAPVPTDVIRVRLDDGRECFFLNAANIGFAASLGKDMHNDLKKWLGTLAYPVMALSQIGTLEPFHLRLTLDDETLDLDAVNLVVGNGQYLGGGVRALPEASPADGMADILAVPNLPLTDLLMMAPALLRAEHMAEPGLICRRARRVLIESIPPIPINVDGEYLGEASRVELEVLPGVLALLGPRQTTPAEEAPAEAQETPAGP